ncbi:hypothetical protein TREMEDRAFT_59163 [Tremella mesenterica DSM 1558]|uniref:uncharacterized protein n=1 Tax=Tremella mesenterica (strain ATCC 24925 / CBS 8224 / DSM 1558 / NBRC 9311 / NRRL Y-6157 / RJB 2259-6 / UBC 559-6) TaxID=578456 RepID=UPI0003F48CAD|nr:uncharacterized protein TREMEDRAFT_59163 [Tremella mesenterica DSM 1558]EIW73004.1 hypothetical protein TREMEDRAFT_59163 [Tremella mesenterica DSM 1558]
MPPEKKYIRPTNSEPPNTQDDSASVVSETSTIHRAGRQSWRDRTRLRRPETPPHLPTMAQLPTVRPAVLATSRKGLLLQQAEIVRGLAALGTDPRVHQDPDDTLGGCRGTWGVDVSLGQGTRRGTTANYAVVIGRVSVSVVRVEVGDGERKVDDGERRVGDGGCQGCYDVNDTWSLCLIGMRAEGKWWWKPVNWLNKDQQVTKGEDELQGCPQKWSAGWRQQPVHLVRSRF